MDDYEGDDDIISSATARRRAELLNQKAIVEKAIEVVLKGASDLSVNAVSAAVSDTQIIENGVNGGSVPSYHIDTQSRQMGACPNCFFEIEYSKLRYICSSLNLKSFYVVIRCLKSY